MLKILPKVTSGWPKVAVKAPETLTTIARARPFSVPLVLRKFLSDEISMQAMRARQPVFSLDQSEAHSLHQPLGMIHGQTTFPSYARELDIAARLMAERNTPAAVKRLTQIETPAYWSGYHKKLLATVSRYLAKAERESASKAAV